MRHLTTPEYQTIVDRLTPRCQEILKQYPCSPGVVDSVVLTCKREAELRRLIESGPAELWWRTTLLDNGSWYDINFAGYLSRTFGLVIWEPTNLGIGRALNNFIATRWRTNPEFILLIEDDLVMEPGYADLSWIGQCVEIFNENPHVGIIKLKNKAQWDEKPWRVIGPMQRTKSGVLWHPWLPSNPWHIWHGNRPWYAGIHNVWSLGPVMFRWAAWAENGMLPTAQGRGQAVAAEDWYARTFNAKWIAARPVTVHPFSQPETQQSPGYDDAI